MVLSLAERAELLFRPKTWTKTRFSVWRTVKVSAEWALYPSSLVLQWSSGVRPWAFCCLCFSFQRSCRDSPGTLGRWICLGTRSRFFPLASETSCTSRVWRWTPTDSVSVVDSEADLSADPGNTENQIIRDGGDVSLMASEHQFIFLWSQHVDWFNHHHHGFLLQWNQMI